MIFAVLYPCRWFDTFFDSTTFAFGGTLSQSWTTGDMASMNREGLWGSAQMGWRISTVRK